MRRCNRLVFQASRLLRRNEAKTEDVVQDAWVRGCTHPRQFAGRGSVATWFTRIFTHGSLASQLSLGRHLIRHHSL